MPIIDSHAHLDHIDDIEGAMKRACKEGVEAVITVSSELESCRKNLAIKEKFSEPKVYLALGMHPSDADQTQVDQCIELMKENQGQLTAVGEVGLDFWYKWVRKDKEKKDEQRLVFRKQLEAASDLNLPAIVHTRGTWREAFDTVKDIGLKKAEFHWYSGPLDVLDDILSEGYMVSTAPSVAYSPQSREAMNHAPIEQTLIETDSPVFFKNRDSDELGFQAEPKDVFRTLDAYCTLKNIDKDKALEILNNNARTFFNL